MNPYFVSLLQSIKNNTNGVAFLVNQAVIMLMLFEAIHWTDAQMFGFLSFMNALFAVIVGKTTVPGGTVDKKVDEKVAHREATTNTERLTGAQGPPS